MWPTALPPARQDMVLPLACRAAHPRRMMDAATIGTSVVIGSVSPGDASVGDARMLGRVAAVPSASSKYGGVKICPSRWFTLLRQGQSSEPVNSLLRSWDYRA